MQRSALCRSRRELSNEYLLAKFGFDTAENEPCKVCPLSAYISPRFPNHCTMGQILTVDVKNAAEGMRCHGVSSLADSEITCISPAISKDITVPHSSP